MKVHRPEYLFSALLSVALGWCTPIFFPTAAGLASTLCWALWVFALGCVLRAFVDREPRAPRPRWVRLAWAPVKLVMGLAMVATLLMMHRSGYFTAFVVSRPIAVTAAVVECVGLAACAWVAWRRPVAPPWTVAVSAALLFAGSFQYVPIAAWLWGPASPDACEELLRAGEVERLSPAEWVAEPSQPFALLYVPEEAWLLAAFKMGGNGSFAFWNDPKSNRLFGVDVRDTSKMGAAPLGGLMSTQSIAYRPDTHEAMVPRQGATTHALDIVSLVDFPEMKKVRSVEVEGAPPVLVTPPTPSSYAVLDERGFFRLLDRDRFDETDRFSLGLSDPDAQRPTDRAPMWRWYAPGTTTVYINVLLHPLVVADTATQQVRWSRDSYGGGLIVGHSPTSELFMTDMVYNRIDVVDMDRLETVRGLDLDYTPRAIAVDPSRDLLMVGSWFDGGVHFYRLSTLGRLDLFVRVGPNLRDFAVDTEGGLLFAASACGVYQVDLDALLGGGSG